MDNRIGSVFGLCALFALTACQPGNAEQRDFPKRGELALVAATPENVVMEDSKGVRVDPKSEAQLSAFYAQALDMLNTGNITPKPCSELGLGTALRVYSLGQLGPFVCGVQTLPVTETRDLITAKYGAKMSDKWDQTMGDWTNAFKINDKEMMTADIWGDESGTVILVNSRLENALRGE